MQSALSIPDDKTGTSNENIFQAMLHPKDFEQISHIVYRYSGIRLTTGKEELVRSRLIKRLRALGIASFSGYMRHIKDDRTKQELHTMIDALTTNKTSFSGRTSTSNICARAFCLN
jgi:chemotaxis protein methyltransferase CheR